MNFLFNLIFCIFHAYHNLWNVAVICAARDSNFFLKLLPHIMSLIIWSILQRLESGVWLEYLCWFPSGCWTLSWFYQLLLLCRRVWLRIQSFYNACISICVIKQHEEDRITWLKTRQQKRRTYITEHISSECIHSCISNY